MYFLKYTQLLRFNNINHLYCFSNDILKWSAFYFPPSVMISSTIWCHCLDSYCGTDSCSHYCFCTISANISTVKRQIIFSIVGQVILTVWVLGFHGLPGFINYLSTTTQTMSFQFDQTTLISSITIMKCTGKLLLTYTF